MSQEYEPYRKYSKYRQKELKPQVDTMLTEKGRRIPTELMHPYRLGLILYMAENDFLPRRAVPNIFIKTFSVKQAFQLYLASSKGELTDEVASQLHVLENPDTEQVMVIRRTISDKHDIMRQPAESSLVILNELWHIPWIDRRFAEEVVYAPRDEAVSTQYDFYGIAYPTRFKDLQVVDVGTDVVRNNQEFDNVTSFLARMQFGEHYLTGQYLDEVTLVRQNAHFVTQFDPLTGQAEINKKIVSNQAYAFRRDGKVVKKSR